MAERQLLEPHAPVVVGEMSADALLVEMDVYVAVAGSKWGYFGGCCYYIEK